MRSLRRRADSSVCWLLFAPSCTHNWGRKNSSKSTLFHNLL